MSMSILLVDDEAQIRRLVTTGLKGYGYDVLIAATGEEGLVMVARHSPDLVVLDISLGSEPDGIEVCRRIREWSQVPVVMLTVRNEDETKVTALDAGADDYLTKPFSMEELRARIEAVMRRVAMEPETDADAHISTGDLEIDLAGRRVTVVGEEVHFTPIEYDILRLLATNRGKIMTHQMLLSEVWGPDYRDMTHYIRIHISHIRRKLQENPSAGVQYILNEPGIGYRFVDPDE